MSSIPPLNKKNFINSDFDKLKKESNDPFYQNDTNKSQLIDNNEFYQIKTKIPVHEKENINIRIQGDKITLSGQRQFKEKKNEGNKVSSTSNYQTYKEEFKFDHPVFEKGAIQNIDGENLTIDIPKLRSLSKKV